MTKKSRATATKREPLTITIRGSGVDISARIDDPPEFGTGFKAAVTSIAEQLAGRLPPPTQAPDPEPPLHDFDVVLRVIKHGDLQVVQAIADLVGRELEARRAAS